MMEKEFDFAIVGGGIMGTSFAYHLLKRGYSVALFDKNYTPTEASVRNFGQVVPSGFGAEWQKYGIASMEIYRSIQKEAQLDLNEEGSLYIASNEEEIRLIEELNAINQLNQYDSIILDTSDINKLYPEIKQSYAKAALHFPLEIQVNPKTTVARILHWLTKKNQLHYFNNVTIQDIEVSSSKIHLTDNFKNEYTAKKVMICSGHDFKTLFPEIFLNAGLKTVKLQMLSGIASNTKIKGSILTGWSIRRYECFHECPSYQQIISQEDPNSFQRLHGIHILAKQEADGTIILGDSHHYASHGPNAVSTDYEDIVSVNDFMITEAKKILNIDHFELRNAWAGLYSQCTDKPILVENISDDITVVTGIGGKGMTASLGYTQEFLNKLNF
jgi:FAD dependent oxidoreductase TIGR03364